MRIRVSDKNLGEIIINTTNPIGKVNEYAVKSLCMLQLMCLNSSTSDEKFTEFIKILRDATKKLNNVYGEKGEDDVDPFEQFNASKL